jgi:hypothetical protein
VTGVRAVIVVAAVAVSSALGVTPQRCRLVRANARSSSVVGREMVSEMAVVIAGALR